MNLLILEARCYVGGKGVAGDVRIAGGVIKEIGKGLTLRKGERKLRLPGHILFPGLINGHDHLDFNLFGRLGSPPYPNSYIWAGDIHHPERSPIREILQASLPDLLLWGGYKNLVSGVTTVVHHNPYHEEIFGQGYPVKVLRDYTWSHSLGFGKDLPPATGPDGEEPFIIHAAEGTDSTAQLEFNQLESLGLIGPTSVLVHGVGLTGEQIEKMSEAGCALVWCPSSNLHLYGATAPIKRLRGKVPIALGTDSTLSGGPDMFGELRLAMETAKLKASEVVGMAAAAAAEIFRIEDGRGSLRPEAPADLIALPAGRKKPVDVLVRASPADLALVLIDGEPRLASPKAAGALKLGGPNILVDGRPKWIFGRFTRLRERLEAAVGGKILAENPLWERLRPYSGEKDAEE